MQVTRTSTKKYKDSIATCQAELKTITDVRKLVIEELRNLLHLASLKASAYEALAKSSIEFTYTHTELNQIQTVISSIDPGETEDFSSIISTIKKEIPGFEWDESLIDDIEIQLIGILNQAKTEFPDKPQSKGNKRSIKQCCDYEYQVSEYIIEQILQHLTLAICYCEMHESVFEQYTDKEANWNECFQWLLDWRKAGEMASKEDSDVSPDTIKKMLKIPNFEEQYQTVNDNLFYNIQSYTKSVFDEVMKKI